MDFQIVTGQKVKIFIGERESEAVRIAAGNLMRDLRRVLRELEVSCTGAPEEADILIETLNMADAGSASVGVDGLWKERGVLRKEAYCLEVIDGRLRITGSDRRGTIYGIYTFCEKIGVSPWYFWADIPVSNKSEIVLRKGFLEADYPSVEYRGIFINDEEELEAWVQKYVGEETIGVKTYEKIFELLLRLKGNYIWPAMHVNSFNQNPENGALADRMGIVVGTSHCDMLMRSNNREWFPWLKKKGYEGALYDYSLEGRNREILQEYWRESVLQNRDFEVCYTLGMRGIHDSGFEVRSLTGGTEEEQLQAKIELLNKIICDQEQILTDELNKETLKTFIPYKEVLELYDHGLEVPEDLTLIWANDNYGHIRRYPSDKEKARKGGNGIYFHNSYWAPPSMSYVFLCSIPLAQTRNELSKAWEEGIRKIWVLNCGALKPLEQEITFFLRLGWEIGKPGALTEDVDAFTADWIDRTFGGEIGRKTAGLLNDFAQITNVRKLENMDYDAFSQTAYGDEAAARIHEYERLFREGNLLYNGLEEKKKPAFFQLVLMKIHAAYYTNMAYYYGDRSTLMYERGNMQAAAEYTKESQNWEDARRKLIYYYNHTMADGKWDGILNPEGFPPPRAAMMPVCTPPLAVTRDAGMRVDLWNEEEELVITREGSKWLELGNLGKGEYSFEIEAPDWLELSEQKGVLKTEKRILIGGRDFSQDRQGMLKIRNLSGGEEKNIPIKLRREEVIDTVSRKERTLPAREDGGLVVLEATGACSGDFRRIKRLGRYRGDLLEACGHSEKPLCYTFVTESEGEFLLELHRFPSLNSVGRLRIGIAVDDGEPKILESFSNDEWKGNWKKNVLHNVDRLHLRLPYLEKGKHELRIYAMDPYFAFSRILLYTRLRKENQLAGFADRQELPARQDILGWCDAFYGRITLGPRPVCYTNPSREYTSLAQACTIDYPERFTDPIKPEWYLERGKKGFEERQGIRIDMACALSMNSHAWQTGAEGLCWRHCATESFGRSGLALYIREPDRRWLKEEKAPALHYRFRCKGGDYAIWLLCKFNRKEEAYYGVGLDDVTFPGEKLYRGGNLHTYEGEQIYRWVLLTKCEIEQGEHVLHIYSMASGVRYERLYLTKGAELPPTDAEWQFVSE